MDYSLYDARRAGFEKVIFIIKHSIEDPFKETIGNHVSKYMEVAYAYQDLDDLPEAILFRKDVKNRGEPAMQFLQPVI